MSHDLIRTHLQLRKPSESRLQRTDKLRLQLSVQLLSGILPLHISTHIRIKKKGIRDPVGINTMTSHSHIHIQPDSGIHNPERDRISSTKLVIHKLLGIKIIHPLILTRITAKSKPLPDRIKGLPDSVTQTA